MLPVTGRCDQIDLFGYVRQYDKAINPECNKGEKEELL